MRVAVIATVVALCAPAVIAQDPFLKGAALQEEVSRNCEDGCLTLNREEAMNLSRNVANIVEQARREAYEAGRHDERVKCGRST